MKLLPGIAAAGATFFLMLLSCASTVDYAKKYPGMVANADPVSAGTIEAEFDRLFSSGLNKTEIEVVFYPRLNAAALEFRYELFSYRQFWDAADRQQFAAALELYKADYAARNLTGQYKKTRAAYGKTKGHTEWETFKYGKTRRAYPVMELGYRFRGETPFFAILMQSAKEELDPADSSHQGESPQIIMYFTRAQADELVKLFDQSYLMGLLEEKSDLKSGKPLVVDPYREWGDEQPW